MPSDKLINPTLLSGKNTRLLILFCQRLAQIAQQEYQTCQLSLGSIATEFGNLHRILGEASVTGLDDPALTKLNYVFSAELSKLGVFQNYGKIIDIHKNTLQLLIRLLQSLLKRQEDHGSEIIKDPKHIEYLVLAYPLINREWINLRKVYILMQKEIQQIASIQNRQGQLQTLNGDIVHMQTVYEYRLELGLPV